MNVFVGNLVRDVEVRETNSGVSVANFSIAINEKFENGEKEITTYLDFEAWGYKAQDIKDLKKGTKLMVMASPRTDSWEKDGKKYSRLKFRAQEVGVCFRARKSDQVPQNTAAPQEEVLAGLGHKLPF